MYHSADRSKTAGMDEITVKVKSCTSCELSQTRNKVVLGAGTLDAKIVLVGEAPGRKEDESGLPFVGSAGKLLDKLLASAGLGRDDVFIGNIIKCRPPKNRRPKKGEVSRCEGYMMEQLGVMKPEVIAPMGNSSLGYFQERFGLEKQVIGDVHGQVFMRVLLGAETVPNFRCFIIRYPALLTDLRLRSAICRTQLGSSQFARLNVVELRLRRSNREEPS